MSYQAVPTSSSSSASDDWFDYMKAVFVTKTRLNSIQWSASITDDLTIGATAAGNSLLTGSGSSANSLGTPNTSGGAVGLIGPSTGTGISAWIKGGSGTPTEFTNARTKRWMLAFRMAGASTPGSYTAMQAGLQAGGSYFGIGFSGASPGTWRYCRGATVGTMLVDLGVAYDGTGTVYRSMYVGNFDLTNVIANANVGISADVTCEASSNLPTAGGYPDIRVQALTSAAASDQLNIDKVIFCCEF